MSTPKRPFNYTITQLRYGTLNDDLTKALLELTNKCADTGKGGELKLTIKLKPGSGGQMEVFDDIVLKLPKDQKTKRAAPSCSPRSRATCSAKTRAKRPWTA